MKRFLIRFLLIGTCLALLFSLSACAGKAEQENALYECSESILSAPTAELLEDFLGSELLQLELVASSDSGYDRAHVYDLSKHPAYQELLKRTDLLDAMESRAKQLQEKLQSGDGLTSGDGAFALLLCDETVKPLILAKQEHYPALSGALAQLGN